ncbi:MAG: PTS transporter subunit EIIC [bacterium]|nr:PTS transporter subunit EIIC [bacterium]
MKKNKSPKQKTSVWQRYWLASVAFLERAAQQRHVLALRDGMIASVPIILVGSVFLLLGAQSEIITAYFNGQVSWLPNLADTSLGKWYLSHTALFYTPYRLTMGLLSLYVAFTIASALAGQYKMPPLTQGLGAAAALLITGAVEKAPVGAQGTPQWVILLKPLGPEGLFLAIILGLAMVEISRLCGFAPKRPKPEQMSRNNTSAGAESKTRDKAEAEGKSQVDAQSSAEVDAASKEATVTSQTIPPSVLEAFRSFAPMLILATAVWLIRHVAEIDINAAFMALIKPLHELGDSLPAVLFANFFMHLFAVAGVHGISVINAVMLPLWQQFVAVNAEAHAAGLPLPHVTAFPFYQWFIWMGGAGATLPATLLLFTMGERWKKLGKMAIVPALFNINEPFLFGMPVVANPLLAIPCILAPLVCGVIAWLAVSGGLVSAPFIEVPWVLPCFLGAPLSTQDWRSIILVAVNFCVSGGIWYPFLRVYTNRN